MASSPLFRLKIGAIIGHPGDGKPKTQFPYCIDILLRRDQALPAALTKRLTGGKLMYLTANFIQFGSTLKGRRCSIPILMELTLLSWIVISRRWRLTLLFWIQVCHLSVTTWYHSTFAIIKFSFLLLNVAFGGNAIVAEVELAEMFGVNSVVCNWWHYRELKLFVWPFCRHSWFGNARQLEFGFLVIFEQLYSNDASSILKSKFGHKNMPSARQIIIFDQGSNRFQESARNLKKGNKVILQKRVLIIVPF